jgi:phospholipid/cholesterol/gamma-HCH transport system substrate-binding protein
MNVEEKAVPYIRKDAFVKVSTDGLIGNKILIIYGGNMQSAEVKENDTLSVEKSLSSEDVINTLQQNNKNFLSITNDIKLISNKIAAGEGTVGKLLNDNALYEHLNQAAISLQATSGRAQQLVNSLATFSDKLNTPGSLINQLTTDTAVFNSIRASAQNLQSMSDSASALVSNLNSALANSKSPAGVLLNDEESGNRLKETIKNLESGSKKLDENLEALQHNFLLRGYFKGKK